MIKITYIILFFILSQIAGKAFEDSEFDEFNQKPLNVDPFEKINRKIFNFNLTIDRNIVRPMAIKYQHFTTEDFS